MTQEDDFLGGRAAFAPDQPLDGWLAGIPARWAIVLLEDEEHRPLQLLALKNLRDGLAGRLSESLAPGRRVNWRQAVRCVRWAVVDSDFEADWVYLRCARGLFPEIHNELIARSRPWFVHVDPGADFPRFAKTTDLAVKSGNLFGPFADKHAAARWIERVEDAFDLCRFHHVLALSPGGKACAYKEMGKCPAPCDGSIELAQYRRMIDQAVGALLEMPRFISEHTARMEQAAGELRFETAGRIRGYIEALNSLRRGGFRHARGIEDFAYVVVQPGSRAGQAKVFMAWPGEVTLVACVLEKNAGAGDILTTLLHLAEGHADRAAADDRFLGLAARHLLAAKSSGGAFVPLWDLNESTLAAALRQAARRPRSLPGVQSLADRTGMLPGEAAPV